MKNNLLIILSILLLNLFNSLNAQESEVDKCEQLQGKPIITGEDMVLFNMTGVNLSNYDWGMPDVNCHINLTLSNDKKSKMNMTFGGTLIGIGIPCLLLIPLIDDPAGPILLATAISGGGIYLTIRGVKQKKLRDYHLNEVSDYYRVNKLNTN
ncbi:MAG: hypothetical protein IPH42_13495 [Bacteroidetes bacterium]|nr:hypothetical protein [Bacteroidota bacterium]